MKIFYAVQATGNGHISRAIELLPSLRQLGEVDIFLSGDNSHLAIDAPVKYKSKGLSLYYDCSGGLDYWKIVRGFHPWNLRREINELRVEEYDLVINDFEFITAAACAKKKVPSIQVGHQASFQSKHTPRPAAKNAFGEFILKNYARSTHYVGLHFDAYDEFILPPVIQDKIRHADPVNKGHVTVYMPSFSIEEMQRVFGAFEGVRFQIFTKEVKNIRIQGNIHFYPVNKQLFQESLIHCHGIITGAGFETPSEAIYLGKKLICIPTRGQYEQLCNAAALEKMGITCLKKIDTNFNQRFQHWYESAEPVSIQFRQSIPDIVDTVMRIYEEMHEFQFA